MSTKRETIQKIVENAKRARSSGKKYTAEITISLDAQAVRMLMVQTGAQTNFNPRTPRGVRLYILCFIQSRNTDKGRTILKK